MHNLQRLHGVGHISHFLSWREKQDQDGNMAGGLACMLCGKEGKANADKAEVCVSALVIPAVVRLVAPSGGWTDWP